MSDTPRCPRCQAPSFLAGINTRIFECESDGKTPSTACKYASQLQDRIKRLEEAGDELLSWIPVDWVSDSNRRLLSNAWAASKEAKP